MVKTFLNTSTHLYMGVRRSSNCIIPSAQLHATNAAVYTVYDITVFVGRFILVKVVIGAVVLNCLQATLYEGLSVHLSVCLSVIFLTAEFKPKSNPTLINALAQCTWLPCILVIHNYTLPH